MRIDYERELTTIAALAPPDQISPAVIAIGAEALQGIDMKYGPASDNPLDFHYGPHSLGVTRRDVMLINLLYPFIKPAHLKGIYNLGMLIGPTHDWEQSLGQGVNELVSTQYVTDRVIETGVPELNTPEFHSRLIEGCLATAAEPRENGEIIQVNLQTGSRDPLKFITSFGDINGIAMEGRRRMLNDAARLAREKYGSNMTLEQLCSYLFIQEGFLRKRLNDHRVKSDIAYHFPDQADEVYQVMRRAFRTNILSAHGAAVLLGKTPVRVAVQGAGMVDSTVLGNRLSKTLYGALTIPL